MMAGSFLAHNGGWDAVCYSDDAAWPFPWYMEVRPLRPLLDKSFQDFSPFDLCEIGRFLAVSRCLDEYDEVLYCDNDLYWYNQYECPPDGEILLTPHFLSPGIVVNNLGMLRRDGFANIGLMHFRGNGGKWLCSHVVSCVKASPGLNRHKGVLWLQSMLDVAPWLGLDFRANNDPGCNVGNWNLRKGDRKLVEEDERLLVEFNGALSPLVSFHFSRKSMGRLLDGRYGDAVKRLAKKYLGGLNR